MCVYPWQVGGMVHIYDALQVAQTPFRSGMRCAGVAYSGSDSMASSCAMDRFIYFVWYCENSHPTHW